MDKYPFIFVYGQLFFHFCSWTSSLSFLFMDKLSFIFVYGQVVFHFCLWTSCLSFLFFVYGQVVFHFCPFYWPIIIIYFPSDLRKKLKAQYILFGTGKYTSYMLQIPALYSFNWSNVLLDKNHNCAISFVTGKYTSIYVSNLNFCYALNSLI